ncbi:MAG: class I SAM-dependent methyltransferase, partial [Bacteroidales bacterium]
SVYSKIKILDVGCCEVFLLKCMDRWFPKSEFYGLDANDEKLKLALQKLKRTKILKHDAHKLPFPNNSFDVISALQVLEHLTEPELFLYECNRVLKSNKFLLIATPNPTGIPAKILKKKWHGYISEHISLKSPMGWNEILKKCGFSVIEEGTTGLTGFKILRIFPFALINWLPMAIFGFFPWYLGESYMAVAKKQNE